MKNNKFSAIAPLYENQEVINDSGEKGRIFNTHFASKSNLIGNNDDPPILQKKDYPELFILNTSPLEVAKLIRSLKKSPTNLPTLSKICESIIHERLLSHCTLNNIITDRQAAYLKGDSTISQLLYLVHQIRVSWGKGKIAHGLFLDISAAYDKVWHKGLIAKLALCLLVD